MKKIIQKGVDICDFCGEEESYHSCPICGRDFCHKCEDEVAQQLYSELGIECSSEVYCKNCIKSDEYKELFDLYREFANLREKRIRRNREERQEFERIGSKIQEILSRMKLDTMG